jgi:hypothetical protein
MQRRIICRRPPRAGAVYVAVLGVTMIVALIGLAAIHLGRVETDVLSGAEQVNYAELLAQSAVELGLTRINADANWRSTYASGVENPSPTWTTLGLGGIRFALVDADGNLADDPNDSVLLRGIGRYGESVQVASVALQPGGAALNCLDAAIHSGGFFGYSANVSCAHVVSSNAFIANSGGTIDGDAWSTGSISGSVTGVKNPNMTPAREMPDPTTVWDYYLANGTRIDIDDIPGRRIDDKVISAGSNPYGSETNSQGIYIIDCEGQDLVISDSRINATLVIVNPGDTVDIDGRINWSPPSANFPAMMVQGDLEMKWDGGSDLDEFDVLLVLPVPRTNFNPAGSPYEGVADNDALDSYPGVINGLVYVSGNLLISNNCRLNGVVVVGGVAGVTATTNMTYDATCAVNPPPGFARGNVMRVIPRTWKRAAR